MSFVTMAVTMQGCRSPATSTQPGKRAGGHQRRQTYAFPVKHSATGSRRKTHGGCGAVRPNGVLEPRSRTGPVHAGTRPLTQLTRGQPKGVVCESIKQESNVEKRGTLTPGAQSCRQPAHRATCFAMDVRVLQLGTGWPSRMAEAFRSHYYEAWRGRYRDVFPATHRGTTASLDGVTRLSPSLSGSPSRTRLPGPSS